MRLFDLHCDTLYRAFVEGKNIISDDCEVTLKDGCALDEWAECMAVWIPDDVRGTAAYNLVTSCHTLLRRSLAACPYDVRQIDNVSELFSHGVMLTLEGSACLGGDIRNVSLFRSLGARIMTLTWNGSCELGDGADIVNSRGLTAFGKEAVREMERCGMVVDLSHASDRLFYDTAQLARKPVIATHSNSRAVHPHRRNLTDEQFCIIRDCGGLVGLNFHRDFLSDKEQSLWDVVRHAEYFLTLGGEDVLAIGSDFDGADMPADFMSIRDIGKLYEAFLKINYSEELVDKIFFANAFNFFQSFDN